MHLFQIRLLVFIRFTYGVISNNKGVLFENGTNLSTLGQGLDFPKVVPQRRKSKLENSPKNTEDGLSKTGLRLVCGEKNWRITMKREFFGRGVPFSPSFIRLGEDPEAQAMCRPSPVSSTEIVLSAGLQDCGSKSKVIGDWLIYVNRLVFNPAPLPTFSGNLIWRGVPTVVSIECHYKRRHTVSGEPLTPTWLPMTSTIQAAGLLKFSLRVIGDDQRSVGSPMVYLQGEPLFLEAAVHAPLHPPLRVYVDYCVVMLDSEPLSKLHYEFVVNQGCLVDSLLPNSLSQFTPRSRGNRLQFSVQASLFSLGLQDEGSQQKQVFIKCHLKALPWQVAPNNLNKACSYHQASFRWRSADGDDGICSCCATADCDGLRPYMKTISSTHTALPAQEKKTNTGVGPLHFRSKTQ